LARDVRLDARCQLLERECLVVAGLEDPSPALDDAPVVSQEIANLAPRLLLLLPSVRGRRERGTQRDDHAEKGGERRPAADSGRRALRRERPGERTADERTADQPAE